MTLMIILTVSLIFIGRYSCKHFDMLSDELIQYVNDHPASCWKASRQNRFKTATDVRNTLGYPPIQTSKYHNLPSVSYDNMDILLPDYFDSREHWDNCSSIKTIHDQSRCVSGWAVASASAISDRICIQTNGKSKPELSALDLISCCTRCRVGCQFGYPKFAWDYWVRSGIVTGDSKGAFSGCLPYPFPKCDHGSNHSHPLCGNITYEPPTCNNTCSPGYPVSYAADKHFGKFIYTVRKNESDIRKEIMLNGPVQASFYVYTDFLNYKSGVYKHLTGDMINIHSVRIIGWGTEDGLPYWLCANSWNEDWGVNGLFKILRGSNECNIEMYINAGTVRN